MLWVRDEPLHEGHLFDLTLSDLLELDLFLARCAVADAYMGSIRRWWDVPAAIDDINELPEDTRQHHPDAMLLLVIRVWGSYRASGRTESLDAILDSGLEWDQVWVSAREDADAPEDTPRGFRAGNTQDAELPDVTGMDLVREVNRRLLDVGLLLGFTRSDVYGLPLYVWLGVAELVDRGRDERRGR